MTPLHQEFGMETRWKDQPFRISSMMRGDRLVSNNKKDARLLKNYCQRSSPYLKLPKMHMSSDYFETTNSSSESTRKSSALSLIDGALEVIDYGLVIEDDDGFESDDDVIVVPVKLDNYVNKRSRMRGDKRRKELLLDNASAITDAINAIQVNKKFGDLALASDEESLDAGDLDDSHKSYQL